MTSKKLLDLLNKAIAREIQVSIQYMWQHVVVRGVEGKAIDEIFKDIAKTEMKHAESIAERLDYLGGRPTTKPDPINVGETLAEMIKNDIKAEEEAIMMYKEIIKVAAEEEDVTTAFLFKQILESEEDHHNTFTTLAEKP
jgi:bacterioferritin